MAQDPRFIEALVHKFQNGVISQDELKILLEWYNGHDDREVVIPSQNAEESETVKARILDNLTTRIRNDRPNAASAIQMKKRSGSINLKWVAAAAVLVFIALFSIRTRWEFAEQASANRITADITSIQPGGNKATLMLADGSEIALSTDHDGIIIGDRISYRDGSELHFDHSRDLLTVNETLVLQTPRGGTYRITLPDGTEVWLNAATTLTYPSRFTEEHRTVEVVGEAYFKVREAYRQDGSRIPFKVMSQQQEIEVLGTEFNISAYSGQAATKTTLVHGRVILKDKDGLFELWPGDQASTTSTSTVLKQVQTGNYVAWREGRFSFDGKSFAEVMNEIAHWYDLTIVYEANTPTEELVGDAFRNQNLGLVLRVLDVAEINYSIDVENRKLIIKGKTRN